MTLSTKRVVYAFGVLGFLSSLLAPTNALATESEFAPHDESYLIENEAESRGSRDVEVPRTPEELGRLQPNEFDVEGVAQRYGISRAEAEERLRIEQASLELPGLLQEFYPDAFAGVWLSQPDDPASMVKDADPNITVALSGSGYTIDKVRQKLSGHFALPERLRLVKAEYSSAQLGNVLAQLVEAP